MSPLARALVLFVIAFHVLVFVAETFLWMNPAVYSVALTRITDASPLDLHQQALVLRVLFVNQGFYNLFVALAGVAGLVLIGRGSQPAGIVLIRYMCLFALGAGVVLALTTRAYVGAFLQAVPSALALAVLRRRAASQ